VYLPISLHADSQDSTELLVFPSEAQQKGMNLNLYLNTEWLHSFSLVQDHQPKHSCKILSKQLPTAVRRAGLGFFFF